MIKGAILLLEMVGHHLHSILLAVHAAAGTPDLAEGAASKELEALKLLVEARGGDVDGGPGRGRIGAHLASLVPNTAVGHRDTLCDEQCPDLLADVLREDLVAHKVVDLLAHGLGRQRALHEQLDDGLLPQHIDLHVTAALGFDNGVHHGFLGYW